MCYKNKKEEIHLGMCVHLCSSCQQYCQAASWLMLLLSHVHTFQSQCCIICSVMLGLGYSVAAMSVLQCARQEYTNM